jgi:hypothetical protein
MTFFYTLYKYNFPKIIIPYEFTSIIFGPMEPKIAESEKKIDRTRDRSAIHDP